jgi:pimeloyl-ACP methyl ester carboxylesterase
MRTSPGELDQRIRDAEDDAYAHYGVKGREKVIRVDGGTGFVDVRLMLFGPEESVEPPVLFLHGIGSATVVAAPLIAHLEGRRVIALDWPGHGLSGPFVLPPKTNIRWHATTTIGSILDVLGIPQVDVVGHSLGAQFGLYAALDLPERVRRLVLLGAPGAAFMGVRPIPLMMLLAVPGVGRLALSKKMSEEVFLRNSELALGAGALKAAPAGLIRAGNEIATRPGVPASVASFFRVLIKGASIRAGVGIPDAELATLTQSTLMVWGDEDVFLAPMAAAASIVSIRDGHLVRLPNSGHAPWLQAETAVGEAVARHLS